MAFFGHFSNKQPLFILYFECPFDLRHDQRHTTTSKHNAKITIKISPIFVFDDATKPLKNSHILITFLIHKIHSNVYITCRPQAHVQHKHVGVCHSLKCHVAIKSLDMGGENRHDAGTWDRRQGGSLTMTSDKEENQLSPPSERQQT